MYTTLSREVCPMNWFYRLFQYCICSCGLW